MRAIVAGLVTGAVIWSGLAAAQDADGPERPVGHIYEFYDGSMAIGVWPTDPDVLPLFSDRLAAELEADDERLETQGMGHLQFDPFIDGQDFAVDGLEIRTTSNSENVRDRGGHLPELRRTDPPGLQPGAGGGPMEDRRHLLAEEPFALAPDGYPRRLSVRQRRRRALSPAQSCSRRR